MYIKRVSIKNIKSIDKLIIDFDSPYEGWHVLLGNNGSGKSSIFKAISLCLIGAEQGYALKQNFRNWISKGELQASCQIDLILDEGQDFLIEHYNEKISLTIKINKEGKIKFDFKAGNKILKKSPETFSKGWYSAGFGPFRRLGERESKQSGNFLDGNLENHITLFDPSYSLTSAIQWLMDLKFEQLSAEIPEEKSTVSKVIWFINHSDLLPDSMKISRVDHQGVYFVDGDNKDIDINELSDGYQSVFALTIEILRQINKRFHLRKVLKDANNQVFIDATGVILIDEVDIHLHPQWQSKIGEWFKKCFPKIQFIVSTHSPIICQSAGNGSIWRIEHSKSIKESSRIIGQDYKRMVYGSISDALGTDNFGEGTVERSDASNEMLDRLALLNLKSIKGKTTDEEKNELAKLKSILPSE